MESGRNGGPDLIPPSVGLSRVGGGGGLWTVQEEIKATSTRSQSQVCQQGAEDELMAPSGIQAEAGNHSEGAGLKSKLSSLRSLLSLYQKAES